MSASNLDEIIKLNYNISIHRYDSEFLLHLSELNLFAQNKDLKIAYKDLEQSKSNLLENYFKVGKTTNIPLPREYKEREDLKLTLIPFFIKLGAFALVCVLLISAANISLTYSLQQAPKKIAQKAARGALLNFSTTFEKIAKNEFTPEKEQNIRVGIRKLVIALKPFMNEFKPLLEKNK